MDMSLSKLRELVVDGEAWRAAVHGVAKSDMTEWLNWDELLSDLPSGSQQPHEVVGNSYAVTQLIEGLSQDMNQICPISKSIRPYLFSFFFLLFFNLLISYCSYNNYQKLIV